MEVQKAAHWLPSEIPNYLQTTDRVLTQREFRSAKLSCQDRDMRAMPRNFAATEHVPTSLQGWSAELA